MSNQAEDASTEKAWHWDCGDEWTAMDSRGDREREREKEWEWEVSHRKILYSLKYR